MVFYGQASCPLNGAFPIIIAPSLELVIPRFSKFIDWCFYLFMHIF